MRTRLFFSGLLLICVGVAHAQTNCTQPNRIIQTCGQYASDLGQFESESVQAYLALHQMPSGDSALIYQYGRLDLRNELRSFMFVNLIAIVQTPAAQRSSHQQNLFNWLQSAVYNNELKEYQVAVAEHRLWQSHPCNYRLDTDIARQYNLTYDPSPFCYPNPLLYAVSLPETPGPDYYLAVGLKNSYNLPLANTPNGALILSQSQLYDETNLAYAAIPATAAGVATGVLYGLQVIAPYAFVAYVDLSGGTVDSVASSVGVELASVAEATGPFAIVAAAAAIAIQAGMQAVQQQKEQDEIADQQNTYNALLHQCSPVDLVAFSNDPSGTGQYKLRATFFDATLPDVPSIQALPTHREGPDPILGLYQVNGPTFDSFNYTDWNGVVWTASPYGGWFVQHQANNPAITSFTATLFYLDPLTNVKLSASRTGTNFVITKAIPNTGDTPCPADTSSGITLGSTNACFYYVSPFLYQQDPNQGAPFQYQIVTNPVFPSPNAVTFSYNAFGQTQLSAQSNNPFLPASITANGALPPGLEIYQNNLGTILDNAQANGPTLAGTYTISVTAKIGSPNYVSTTQNLTVNVVPGDAFTSPATFNGFVRQSVNFVITTSGTPNPVISLVGITLPPGLQFKDNGNGTAVISGSTTILFLPSFCTASFCGVQTNFGASQPLQLTISYPQTPGFSSPNTWNFAPGVPASFKVQTLPGGSHPSLFVSALPPSPDIQPGVITPSPKNTPIPIPGATFFTFLDEGNGWADIVGTPPAGASAVTFFVTSASSYQYHSVQRITFNFFTQLAIVSSPAFVTNTASPLNVTISANAALPITNANGTFQFVLPGGTQFGDNHNGTATLSGTPTAGSGGVYTLPILVSPGCSTSNSVSHANSAASTALDSSAAAPPEAPSATQYFNLQVNEAPSITSTNAVSFFVNTPNSFAVSTSGFPKSQVPLDAPTGEQPMRVTLTNGALPPGLTFSDLSAANLPTGVGLLSGTPTSTGSYPLTFTAINGVGSPFTQTFSLTVKAAGDLNGDGVVNCSDVANIVAAFGQYEGQTGYTLQADANHDGVVDASDLEFVLSFLPQGCPILQGTVVALGTVLHNGVTGEFAMAARYLHGKAAADLLYTEHQATGQLTLISTTPISVSVVGTTAIVQGVASLNSVAGYSMQVVLADQTGSGKIDQIGLQIKDPSGALLPNLSFAPTAIKRGVIQVGH